MPLSENEDSEDETITSVKKIKKRAIIDSDSDEDVCTPLITNVGLISTEDTQSNDSDVELEVAKVVHVQSTRRIKRLVSNSDSEKENDVDSIEDDGANEITESMAMGDEINETSLKSAGGSPELSRPVYKPKYDPDLYDAEESGDESTYESPVINEDLDVDKHCIEEDCDVPKKSGGKNSKDKKKKKKEKVKSSSEAMREIRKESQRMLRESSCVLPYHRPKQRTLAEFIQRRKSVPSIPLKTSQEHLMRIGKQIEELQKQSEEFFKSDDSESSDDEYIPDYLKNKNKLNSKTDNNTVENTADKALDINCTVNTEVNSNKSVNSTNNSLLHIDSENNHNSQNCEDSVTHEKNNLQELQNQNNDSETVITELLNRVKQRLFDDINLASSVSSQPENQENIDNTVNSRNSNRDTDEFNFELKINEDSNRIVEPKSLNSNNCETNSSKIETELMPSITVPEKSLVHSEIPCSKSIECSNQNKISSSHSYCFQNSEDFSLRIDDSEQIDVDSENINEQTENKDTNDENNEIILKDDITKALNEQLFKTSEEKDKNNENSDAEASQMRNATGSLEIKSQVLENDLLKNKFHGINVDLTKVPQLKGNSNEKINLFSPPKSSALSDLKKRFFQHFTMEKRKKIKEEVEISVVTTEVSSDGAVNDIKNEKINTAANRNEDKWLEDIKEAQLPGAKLSRLKAHLEKQLEDRWKEEFDKRVQEYKINEEEKIEEDAKSDYEDEAILDDEDVETDITETESEEELEENDIPLVDKKRPQSKFLDDEADETDGEDQEDQDNGGEEDAIEENEDVLLGNNDDNDSSNDSDSNEFKTAISVKRKSCFSEEDEDLDEDISKNKNVNKSKIVEEEDMEKLGVSRSEENFLIPSTESQPINKDLCTDDFSSPSSCRNSEIFFNSQQEQKSGKFTCIDDLVNCTEGIEKLSQLDIMRICSGTFPSQPVALSQLENSDEQLKYSQFNCSSSQSQDLNLTFPDFTQSQQNNVDENLNGNPRKETGVVESDDEGDDDDEIFEKSQKNKKHCKIQYSDDEDENSKEIGGNSDDDKSDNEEIDNDEERDEQDNFFDNPDIIGNEDDDAEIEYDSEENEIIKDGKSFLEKEAELSESEWGSEDEDEKDLDKFEAEAGDEDELDQDQLKGELGKIHMQRMLVEDKNEVRLLKELLLEDGELHSDESGRVRRFRWANADGDDSGVQTGLLKDSDDEDSDHGDDENWRRKRHERELYIQKQQDKLRELGIEDVIEEKKDNEENDLLDIGRAMLKKIQKTQTEPKPLSLQKSIKVKVGIGPCGLNSNAAAIKRGSFLKSSDNYLSRLAHITSKVGSDGNVNGPKNSRNFVFSVVSPPKKGQEDDETEKKVVKKRKADEKIESSKKKIHFSDEVKSNGPQKSLLEILTASN